MKLTSHLVPALLASFVSVPAVVSASHHLHPKVYPPGPLKVDKRAPQITQLARLARRDTQQTCGVSESLCPSSMNGGCCPDNYECGTASCTASSSKPGTCQGKTSFYACAQDVGGGCCPDGYMCNRSNGCVPPSGMPYTYSCPASHYLCPASMSYGCCPNGMGCAMYQCYSTEATTQTVAMTVTTTEDGTAKTFTTKETTVVEPNSPTTAPTVHPDDSDADQHVLKYFPSVVPKTSSSAVSSSDDGSSSSIPTGTLVGIVVGAVAFLVLVVAGAIILIKYMNRLARNVASPHGSSGSGRPNMGQYRPTPTDVDAMSEDPFLMKSPSQVHARSASADSDSPYGPASPGLTSTLSVTPSSFAGGYRLVSPGPSTDGQVNTFSSYFDPLPSLRSSSRKTAARPNPRSPRLSSSTATGGKRTSDDGGWSRFHILHSRNWSNDSDQRSESAATSTPSELEAKKYVAELPNRAALTRDEVRRLSNNAGNIPEPVKKEASRRRRAAEGRMSGPKEGGTSFNAGLSPEINLGLGVVSEEDMGESRRPHKSR